MSGHCLRSQTFGHGIHRRCFGEFCSYASPIHTVDMRLGALRERFKGTGIALEGLLCHTSKQADLYDPCS